MLLQIGFRRSISMNLSVIIDKSQIFALSWCVFTCHRMTLTSANYASNILESLP